MEFSSVVERSLDKGEVIGSNPIIPIKREVAQFGRVHGLGPWGRRFESCFPDGESLIR